MHNWNNKRKNGYLQKNKMYSNAREKWQVGNVLIIAKNLMGYSCIDTPGLGVFLTSFVADWSETALDYALQDGQPSPGPEQS